MIHLSNVTYTYPGNENPALLDLSLDLAPQSFTLVIGSSGAGKSTFLRCLNGLVPHFSGGDIQGSIQVNGHNPITATPRLMSRHVGFVFQDPEAQFVVDRVEDEIAFALENEAVPPGEMQTTVTEILNELGLTDLRNRRIETLSGGERQRVAIAAALALRPKVLVLDEPTSQLDPASAEAVLKTLVHLNRKHDLTIILAEHRLERILPFVNQMIYLDGNTPGVIAGSPRQVLRQVDLNAPLISLGKALGWKPLPLTIDEGREFSSRATFKKAPTSHSHWISKHDDTPYLLAANLVVLYDQTPVLKDLDLGLYKGQITVLMGPNGAGKSTLLRSLVGLAQPGKGKVTIAGEDIADKHIADICRSVGFLPQDPNSLLFADSVRDELLITLKNQSLSETDHSPEVLLDRFGLAELASNYPRDLSAGQRQRVAMAAIMITHPGALLLDEPTRGLDYAAKQELVRILQEWRESGVAILLVTHDVELAAAIADRVVLLESGQITADGTPVEVLGSSILFVPQIAQLFPGSGWLTADDALEHLRVDIE
jgi:energy-coupling factor transport system ATP-binding protein